MHASLILRDALVASRLKKKYRMSERAKTSDVSKIEEEKREKRKEKETSEPWVEVSQMNHHGSLQKAK